MSDEVPGTPSRRDLAETSSPERPVLRVVSGSPSPEEVAALVAVLAAAAGGARSHGSSSRTDPPRSGWADHARAVRAPVQAGPGAWRASAFPT